MYATRPSPLKPLWHCALVQEANNEVFRLTEQLAAAEEALAVREAQLAAAQDATALLVRHIPTQVAPLLPRPGCQPKGAQQELVARILHTYPPNPV